MHKLVRTQIFVKTFRKTFPGFHKVSGYLNHHSVQNQKNLQTSSAGSGKLYILFTHVIISTVLFEFELYR